MTNSGVPQFPQPSKQLEQYRSDSSQARRAGDNDSSIGKLDRAPDEIRAEITARRKEIRLQGEVTRIERDGNIRVSTPRGDVDVQLPPDQPRPQLGQRVEVEIEIAPPPPRADVQPQQQQDTAPQVTLRPAPQNADAPVRPSATPVQVELRGEPPPPRVEIKPPNPDTPQAPSVNTFPETGSLVRLDPVTPQQLEQLVETRQVIVAENVRAAITLPPSVSDVLPLPSSPPPLSASVPAPSVETLNVPISNTVAPPPAQTPLLLLNAADTPPLLSAASPLNSVSLLDAVQPLPPTPDLTQSQSTTQTTIAPLNVDLTLPNVASDTKSEGRLNVPILTRAQAAIAQLQNAANSVSADNPTLPAAQDVRIATITPPSVALTPPNQALSADAAITPQNTLTSSRSAAQLSGVVIAKTQAQVPIVQFSAPQNADTPLTQAILNTPPTAPLSPIAQQTYILQFPSDALLLGSRIDVTPQALLNATTTTAASTSAAQAPTLTTALAAVPFANMAFPQAWPVFEDIQQSLLQSSAQGAAQTAQAFSNVIPNPANASQFGPAAMLFVAAMRGGDMGSWLSDKASDILRSTGKSSLMSRVGSESATLSRTADAPSGEWRGMNIPLMWEGDIQKIALHYKHDGAGDSDDDPKHSGNKGTRFIFDLNLDVMGKVQLDGFFRPVSEHGPRLDVVLRSEERFSGAMQAEMRRVYMDAIKPSQVGGELSFQDGMESWVMIDAEADAALGVSA